MPASGEHVRRVRQLIALARGLGGAFRDGRDLRLRACAALVPGGALGDDRLEPALGMLGLPRQRLRLGAGLGQNRAAVRDLGARRRKLGFQRRGGLQLRRRLARFVDRRRRLVAAGGEPRARLVEGGKARGHQRALALGGRVGVARRIGLVLARPPVDPRLHLGAGGGERIPFGFLDGGTPGRDLGVGGGELAADLGEPVLLGEPPGGCGRRIGGGDVAVPAPEIALARNQPLPGLEQRRKARPVGAGDDPDLRQPARQLGRRRS